MIHIYYAFIIVVSVILSSIITSALPTLKQKWAAFRSKRKNQQVDTNVEYLLCKVEELENKFTEFEEKNYNRKNNIKRVVREYLIELQK